MLGLPLKQRASFSSSPPARNRSAAPTQHPAPGKSDRCVLFCSCQHPFDLGVGPGLYLMRQVLSHADAAVPGLRNVCEAPTVCTKFECGQLCCARVEAPICNGVKIAGRTDRPTARTDGTPHGPPDCPPTPTLAYLGYPHYLTLLPGSTGGKNGTGETCLALESVEESSAAVCEPKGVWWRVPILTNLKEACRLPVRV